MVKTSFLLLISCFVMIGGQAQVSVSYTINTSLERHIISPYIYGINNGVYKKATFRRFGGNRTSAYNWEDNFSNAGVDYINNNDNYLPSVMNLAPADYTKPAACLIAFHDTSLLQHAFSAITLPMVGYVSHDGNGVVSASELAPSQRWDQVINIKPGALSLLPDTSDHKVYVNEELNKLINTFGKATSATGINGYILDNEPGLWCHQFPHMRTNCVTYQELFTKTIALTSVIKTMDTAALTFGPESFGFSEYWNLQSASDAGSYKSDHWFIDSYLKTMKHASDSVTERLLDVFSVHWYPETDGSGASIFSNDTSRATAIIRMQRPRTLWDSSYTENTWIPHSGFAADLPIIPHILHSIALFYPGTKMAITEYDYGAHNHISGGIAQADVLGVFGKCGLDYASLWTEPTGFAGLAFDIYRNYSAQFGSEHVAATSNDTISTIYAATADTTDLVLHAIVTNKEYDHPIKATINIQSRTSRLYGKVDAYYFSRGDSVINYLSLPASTISANVFTYTIPPLSVYHFVFSIFEEHVKNISGAEAMELTVWPNPAARQVHIDYQVTNPGKIIVYNETGKIIQTYTTRIGKGDLILSPLPAGTYIIQLTDGNSLKNQKVSIL